MNKYIDIIISQNATQFYAQYVQISHNYMFRPILDHLQVVPYSLARVFRLPHSQGYKEQPEDGLKWAETCSCERYCTCCA